MQIKLVVRRFEFLSVSINITATSAICSKNVKTRVERCTPMGNVWVYCSILCEFAFLWGLDFNLLNTINFLTLIISFGCHTVWMWAILPTFRRYMLPPFSGLKCVGWWLCFALNSRDKGDWCYDWPVGRELQRTCADGPFKGPGMQTKFYRKYSWAVKRPVCTSFLVYYSYWPRQGTSPHYTSPELVFKM